MQTSAQISLSTPPAGHCLYRRASRSPSSWQRAAVVLACLVAATGLAGCGVDDDERIADGPAEPVVESSVEAGPSSGAKSAAVAGPAAASSAAAASAVAASALVDASAADPTVVVFLGDSLTAGYGLDSEQAFPSLVERALLAEGRAVRVVNAGVSGDTTAGGARRLDWLLKQEPDVLVVGLGGNDGLRGVDLDDSERNLRQILERGRQAGARLLLLGMMIPPNYGQDYADRFAAIYPRLADELAVPRVPFLLDGVAGDPALNQADGIHPTAEGQEILAQTVLEHLRPLLPPAPGPGPRADGP